MPLGKENLASITYKREGSEGTVGLCLHCYHIAPYLAKANVYRNDILKNWKRKPTEKIIQNPLWIFVDFNCFLFSKSYFLLQNTEERCLIEDKNHLFILRTIKQKKSKKNKKENSI